MAEPIRKYSSPAISLHWLIAILIFGLLALGWYMLDIQRGTPARAFYFNLHKSIGLVVGLLIVLQLFWRTGHKPPPLPSTMSVWQIRATGIAHTVLYVLIVIMVASGYVEANFTKYGVKFFGTPLPPWGPEDERMSALFARIHEYAAYAITALLVGHVGAALYHLIIKRDSVFQRMLPGDRT